MTYSDIVNRIQDVVNQHLMLADFGYGDLSDLKVRFENKSGDSAVQADYPYAFLRALPHNRNKSAVTYNFDLIVMDLAREELNEQVYNNMLAIQSQCQQYIDDIISQLYYGYKDQPEVKWDNVTYTPFNERFQDSVAGMTANLSIVVPNAINNCVAPFNLNFVQIAARRLGVLGRTIDWDGYPEPDPGDDRFLLTEAWDYDTNTWYPAGGIMTPYGEVQVDKFECTVAGTYRFNMYAAVRWNPPLQYNFQLLYGLGLRLNSNVAPPVAGSTYLNELWISPSKQVFQNAQITLDLVPGDSVGFYWLPPVGLPVPTANTAGVADLQIGNMIEIYKLI